MYQRVSLRVLVDQAQRARRQVAARAVQTHLRHRGDGQGEGDRAQRQQGRLLAVAAGEVGAQQFLIGSHLIDGAAGSVRQHLAHHLQAVDQLDQGGFAVEVEAQGAAQVGDAGRVEVRHPEADHAALWPGLLQGQILQWPVGQQGAFVEHHLEAGAGAQQRLPGGVAEHLDAEGNGGRRRALGCRVDARNRGPAATTAPAAVAVPACAPVAAFRTRAAVSGSLAERVSPGKAASTRSQRLDPSSQRDRTRVWIGKTAPRANSRRPTAAPRSRPGGSGTPQVSGAGTAPVAPGTISSGTRAVPRAAAWEVVSTSTSAVATSPSCPVAVTWSR